MITARSVEHTSGTPFVATFQVRRRRQQGGQGSGAAAPHDGRLDAPEHGGTPKDLRFWRTVFPQMSTWLPPEEREAMCSAFTAEVSRLEARAAA